MGDWGPGLYSGDYAADLRSTISAIMQLPYNGDRLFEILYDTEENIASDPDDEEHTIFWLVAADQFLKRGIVSSRLKETALSIIDNGRDLSMMESLEMSPPDLKKRGAILLDLRSRLTTPSEGTAKERKVLAKTQPYLMEVGDCYIYPTSKGKCWNSYFGTIEEKASSVDWLQDGWGVMIVAERGRAFEFLTWYRPLVMIKTLSEKPTADTIFQMPGWVLESPGTITASHFKRKKLEKIAHLPIDIHKLDRLFPKRPPGTWFAINDIGIGNKLNIPTVPERKNELKNLENILSYPLK